MSAVRPTPAGEGGRRASRPAAAVACAAATALLACAAEPAPAGAGNDRPGVDAPAAAIDARPVTERYLPGSDWYDYDDTTHAITPRDEVWLFEGPRGAWLVAFDSYYDDRGASGTFSWRVRTWTGEAWTDAAPGAPAGNVKDAPVCVRLDRADVTPCDVGDHDLWFGIESRVVPAAGFAVRNPAIHPRGHHWDPERALRAHRLPGAELDAVTDPPAALADATGGPLPAPLDVAGGVLGATNLAADAGIDRFQLATADMQLVWWRAWADADGVHVESACAPLAMSARDQSVPSTGATVRSVALDDRTGLLIDLCSDATVGPWTNAGVARAHDAAAWDLAIERTGDRWAVRLSPGALVIRTASGSEDPAMPLTIDPPVAGFWD